MNNQITHKGQTYSYITNYREHTLYRHQLNQLTRKIYHFDFENWYQDGYWQEQYIPYSLIDGGKIISNVSISLLISWWRAAKRAVCK